MNTYAYKIQENKSQLMANENEFSQKVIGSKSTFQFVDNRPEAIVQRKLQEMANNSPQVMQLKTLQNMADNSPQAKQAAQLQAMADNYAAQQYQPVQKKENETGLGDNLKSGIENLSGYSMNDVKVHYNSDKPAQLQAHAYTQGTDIHLGSGQEKHLPHEAWHVVQQKQGRVKPTMQMKDKVNINDDAGLEKEADVMGSKALNLGDKSDGSVSIQRKSLSLPDQSVQRLPLAGDIINGAYLKNKSSIGGQEQPIQCWLPLGHRLVTTKMFDEGDHGLLFSDSAKKYLIARSPDVDFIQDEPNAMEAGGDKGDEKIAEFYKCLGHQSKGKRRIRGLSGKAEVTQDGIDKAHGMWENNEIHKREKWYMLHHGEGGFYKEEQSVGAAKNIAMTEGLVARAAGLYRGGNKLHGLSILSDALHQAEDRGAHEEGAAFKGHDKRYEIKGNSVVKMVVPLEQQSNWTNLELARGKKSDPDNASKNKAGVQYGIKYAEEAIGIFLAAVGDVTTPINLSEDEDDTIGTLISDRRRAKISKVTGTSHGKTGRVATAGAMMTTSKDALKAVTADLWKSVYEEDAWEDTSEEHQARWKRETPATEMSTEGETDVEAGLYVYNEIYVIAEIVRSLWKTKPSHDDKKKSAERIDSNYKTVMDSLPDEMTRSLQPREAEIKQRALDNYAYQREAIGSATQPAPLKHEDMIKHLKHCEIEELKAICLEIEEAGIDDYNAEYYDCVRQELLEKQGYY